MSDGMEREKNEKLTAREIEEEEMKRELTGIGIYEPGITYKQMKRLLEFVNESQDTSNVTSNNKNIQEDAQQSDNECLSDITSDANKQEAALQEGTEMPRPSYSYILNRTSPTTHERKAVHRIKSPESPSLFDPRNPAYRCRSSDSDDIFEKQYDSVNAVHSPNQFPTLRPSTRERQKATERRTAQGGAQDEANQKLERWRLNPLDVCINENDVPLRQPDRPTARERMPFGHCCKEGRTTSERSDQVMRSVSQHLKEMADLYCSWCPVTNPIIQWGSPIQVGTANGSLDKKPLTDPETEQVETESAYRDTHERASKRKANTLIASLNRNSSTEDEADDRRDLARARRKRAQSDDKSSSVERAANQHARASHKKATSNAIASQERLISDDNTDTEVTHLCSKKRVDEEDGKVSPELIVYPRRITPPNPKTRLSLIKHRRGRATSKPSPKTGHSSTEGKVVEQARNEKKDNALTEEEIRRTLEEDWGENKDEEEAEVVKKHVEMRPLPIPKEIRFRLREKRLPFDKMKTTAKETRAMAKEEDSDEERNKKKRLKLCGQQKKEELCKTENKNGSWEHQLLSSDEELPATNQESAVQNGNQLDGASTATNNVSCPICSKWFPHNEIEDHAADCEQFEANNEEDDNDTNQLECNICSNYKTVNGMEYENHVQQCINNKNSQRHSRGSEDNDTTSTSSFRHFTPISEQKNSEIDYLGLFPSNNKKNIRRKRKR